MARKGRLIGESCMKVSGVAITGRVCDECPQAGAGKAGRESLPRAQSKGASDSGGSFLFGLPVVRLGDEIEQASHGVCRLVFAAFDV